MKVFLALHSVQLELTTRDYTLTVLDFHAPYLSTTQPI